MFDQLNDIIEREIERSRLPGLAIALVRGDEMVWARGYGYADLGGKVPVTPSTVFHVVSVTKPIVATALMQLHDRGRFGLDDPVNQHLAPLHLENEWEDTAPVTIRQLLTHTSGIPEELAGELRGGSPTRADGSTMLQDYVASVAKTVRRRCEEIIYSNWGYDILGYLVGRFAGQSYDAYLSECLLRPLGMASSRIGRPSGNAPVATGYFLSAIDGQHHATEPLMFPTEPARPCGGLYSTVEDLARFLVAHLNGGTCHGQRVLSAKAVAEMHSLQARAGGSRGGMGLGFRVDGVGGRRLICHGGDGSHFTAFIGAYPDERVGVVVLTNVGRAQTARSVIANAALHALLGDYEPSPLTDPARRATSGQWEGMTGRYLSTFWGIEATLVIQDGLPLLNFEGASFIASEEAESSHLLQDEDGIVWGVDGPFDGFELNFEHDAAGRATRFYGGVYPFRFDREGDLVPAAALRLDEEAELIGGWRGTIVSPLGAVPMTLQIVDSHSATATALAAQDAAVQGFSAERGRVVGYLDTSLPGFGDFRVFLRLNALRRVLQGRVYARGAFGEASMKAELTRE